MSDSLLSDFLEDHVWNHTTIRKYTRMMFSPVRLTDKVVKTEQCPGEFTIILHDDPNLRADTSVN